MMKKLTSIGLVCAMCMALMSVSVAAAAEGEVPQAANSVSGSTASGAHEVVIEGEPGDIIVVGDLVFEIIDPEEMEELASQPVPYASTTRWTNVSLSGTEMSKKFEVTSSYPYAKVWISNQGKGDIQFTITRGSDTGTLVSGSAHTYAMKGILIGTIALIYLLTFFILRASTRLVKVLGETGNNVMMRLMGLILMVIAVECFVSGAKPILADIVREGLSGICK